MSRAMPRTLTPVEALLHRAGLNPEEWRLEAAIDPTARCPKHGTQLVVIFSTRKNGKVERIWVAEAGCECIGDVAVGGW